jgi:hypothetical protein
MSRFEHHNTRAFFNFGKAEVLRSRLTWGNCADSSDSADVQN